MTLSLTPVPQMRPAAIVTGADMNMLVGYLKAQNDALVAAINRLVPGSTPNAPLVIDNDGVKSLHVINPPPLLSNTEYAWQIPIYTKRYIIQSRGGEILRISDTQGVVATSLNPYFTVKAGVSLADQWVRVLADNVVIYIASTSNNVQLEILVES